MDFNYDTGTIDTVSILDTTEASPLLGGVTGVLYVLGAGAVSLPYGSTGQQPSPAIGGMLRYNTAGYLEFYNATVPTWQTLSTGGGSVTSITVTTDSPALKVSTGSTQTITTSGTFALQLAATLDSLGNLASNGILVNNSGTISAVTITGTAGNITVTNGSGTAGNPTINLATVTPGASGAFDKCTTDSFGRVVDYTAVTQSDITTVVGTYYLPESSGTMSGNINMGGNNITNLVMSGTPAATDVANVGYVQSYLAGLSWKEAVTSATTAPLSSVTYNNGASGVGATLTDTSTGTVLVIDGYTVALNDRVLIKNQANPIQNGIYTLTTVGVSGTTPYVLTRTTDTNTGTELFGAAVYVDEGTNNANTGWTQTTSGTITIGTSNIVWSQFSGSGTYTAGTGISIVGSTISNTGVLSFQTSLSGLTPSTATNGVVTLGGTLGISSGGTGQITKQAAFDALSPLGTAGDMLYFNGTHNVALPIGTNGYVLQVVSGEPAWSLLTSIAVTSVTGTANEITASPTTGAVTLSIPNTFIAPGSVQVTTTFQTSATNSITAAGASQGTATALTTDFNVVTSAAVGTGVRLPTPLAGNLITVVNRGANPVFVYPAASVAIDGLAVNNPVTLPVNQTYTVEGITSTQMYSVLPTFSAGTGLSITDTNGLVTYTNTGVTSITGTANQITASASTGAVTLSLPNSVSINSITLTGLTANSFIYSGTGGLITSTAAPTNGQLLIGSTGAAPVANTLTAGTAISITNGAGSITINNTGVTSVSLNENSTTAIYTTSPTTATTGAVAETITLKTQTANFGFFGPTTGAAAQPTFRALVYADVVSSAIKLYAEDPSSPVAPSATGANSIAIGSAAVSSQYGGLEHAAGEFSTAGDAQHGTFVLRRQTTNATQAHLFLDGASLEYTVPANTVVAFNIMVAAINTAVTGAGGGWKWEGVVYRGATVSTTAFIGTPAETTLGRSAGFTATVTVTASASTGALQILVTGLAATTIN